MHWCLKKWILLPARHDWNTLCKQTPYLVNHCLAYDGVFDRYPVIMNEHAPQSRRHIVTLIATSTCSYCWSAEVTVFSFNIAAEVCLWWNTHCFYKWLTSKPTCVLVIIIDAFLHSSYRELTSKHWTVVCACMWWSTAGTLLICCHPISATEGTGDWHL